MDAHYATIDQPATAEFVLAVLRDRHRQQCQYDSVADPHASLSFDSTVAEWRDACDLVAWRELGRAHNDIFGIDCTDEEWQAVLEPAQEKRLAGVCALIARYARRPLVRPAQMFGCTCRPAGAFLTVRSLLQKAGACATEIGPSTSLAPYARRYYDVFLGPVSQLAPGTLPLVRIHAPVYDAAGWGVLGALVCLAVGACGGLEILKILGVVVFAVSYTLQWYAALKLLPASVEFGELRTFRDLAIALAEADAAEPAAGAPRVR